MSEETQTPATPSNPGSIVVAIDYSETGDTAMRTALNMAGQQHDLHVVHVIPGNGTLRTSGQIERTNAALEEAATKLKEYIATKFPSARTASGRIGVHVRLGEAVDEILQLAVDVDADLLVVGTHGRTGVRRMILGSVAEHLVRGAHCAVLVVRPKDYDGIAQTAKIDPPCPECVRTRRESNNAVWWCEEHNRKHVESHHYSLSDSVGCEMFDSNVIPTGVRF